MENPKSVDPIHSCGYMHPDTQACPTDTAVVIVKREPSTYQREHWGIA